MMEQQYSRDNPRLDESGTELPEDMTALLNAAINLQNQMILRIATEIATSNTTINDLHIEFAEKMEYANYDADYMINELERWQAGSRQRIESAISEAFEQYYPLPDYDNEKRTDNPSS